MLPKARLGTYLGVEAPLREPEVAPEQLDAELEALRERLARLQTVERPSETGDFVVIDYVGAARPARERRPGEPFAGGEARDQLLELGSGRLIPGFEEALVGASAGDVREVPLTFPAEYPNEQLAGREASFEVTVKEVKAKELPAARRRPRARQRLRRPRAAARGHLRAPARGRRGAREAEFRQAALDAAVDGAEVDVTPELIDARAKEMWERMLHSLSHRGITREGYLRLSGNREERGARRAAPRPSWRCAARR